MMQDESREQATADALGGERRDVAAERSVAGVMAGQGGESLGNVSGFPSRSEWDSAVDAEGNYYNLAGEVIDGPRVASGEVVPPGALSELPAEERVLPDFKEQQGYRDGQFHSRGPRNPHEEANQQAGAGVVSKADTGEAASLEPGTADTEPVRPVSPQAVQSPGSTVEAAEGVDLSSPGGAPERS